MGLWCASRERSVQTNSEASPFTDTLGVNPTQDGLAKPCKVPCHCCDLTFPDGSLMFMTFEHPRLRCSSDAQAELMNRVGLLVQPYMD